MSTKAQLLELANRVEAGSGYDAALRNDVQRALGIHTGMKEILTSVDAVKALRERLYSNFEATIVFNGDSAVANLRRGDVVVSGASKSESRARLAAILRAYAEMTT